MKKTKQALFSSVVALILCFSMLVGTTFAWFTDEVTSSVNQIIAGNLDVNLYHTDSKESNKPVKADTLLFDDVNPQLWEPGALAYEILTVANEGTLALKYQLSINFENATAVNGKTLADALKVAVVEDGFVEGFDRAYLQGLTYNATLESFVLSGELAAGKTKTYGIVVYWEPTDNDNDFNVKDNALSIDLGVRLLATQMANESDSFGSDYDTDALYPPVTIHYEAALDIAAEQLTGGALNQPVTIGSASHIHAVVSEGFLVVGDKLTLKIDSMTNSTADVALAEGASAQSFEICIDGVASGNSAPAVITVPGMLPSGLSELKVKLYHVEGAETKPMTRVNTVAEVDAHNEFYYDAANGCVTLGMASFSEVMAVVNPTYEGEILVNATGSATLEQDSVTDGQLSTFVEIAASEDIKAEVPAGVKLTDEAEQLTLNVVSVDRTDSQADVTATQRSEVVRSVDVHIDGVAADNTVPVVVTINNLFPTGLNSNNVKLYHVENGKTVEMTLVTNPVNHNEFSYDPLTGNAVIALASFSEIVAYGNTRGDWDGKTTEPFTVDEDGTILIANAAQLAYFRDVVDGKVEDYEGDITFAGQTVKLTANINLQGFDEETQTVYENNFDPIGFGYDYDGFMTNGKTFNGTFDGGIYDAEGNLTGSYTIFGLYQNGWEENDCGNTYDYSMAGGGLFASVCDATIMNLTISGADIVMECIDMGVLAGYAQGNCKFDNIAIINCTIQNYNRYTGGVVGEVSPRYNSNGTPVVYTLENGTTVNGGYHVFNNIRVDSTTVVSSLWGSFDTSLGGILGGKWDKFGANTQVVMTNCDVACKIDAFNDVTSAYQWYAYRRAGMLIGNTEQSANHKALADFLTCENVYVYYGEWNNYHYCEFENQSDAAGNSSSWNRYPWVRVESGLSCGAYSNPRYGHPKVNGVDIVDSIHSHQTGDQCMVSLPFAQLYGGGQGVYGATEHKNADGTIGVKEGAYTVTYINYGETIKVEFVSDNSKEHTLWDCSEYVYGDDTTKAWVDGNGKEVSSIDDGNTKNYIVYPKFAGEFTIRFFDAEGNVVYYETFTEGKAHNLNTTAIEAARLAIQDKVDASGKIIVISWDRPNLETISKSEATQDIKVSAVYNLSENSSITLTPVPDASGKTISYKVTDTKGSDEDVLIAIPPYVGTIPVEEMSGGAFAGFDNLHVVTIPTTVTYIGANALASNWSNNVATGDKGETMTLYYAGSYREWLEKVQIIDGWSNGVSADTRLFFLNGTDTVDFGQGYLQFVVDEVHDGWFSDGVNKGHFEYVSEVPSSFVSEYYKNCDCTVDGCRDNPRPDAHYWVEHVPEDERTLVLE